MASSSQFTCSMCYHYTSSSIDSVLRHIGSVHAHQANFNVLCGIQGCPRTYTNYHSFRKHLRRKHICFVSENVDIGTQILDTNYSPPWSDYLISENLQSIDDDELLMKSMALFVLKSKEVRQVSQVALNDLIGDIALIVEKSLNVMASNVASVLRGQGIDVEEIGCLKEALSDEKLRNPFKGLDTAYSQKKAYSSLGLVVRLCINSFNYIVILGTCGKGTRNFN